MTEINDGSPATVTAQSPMLSHLSQQRLQLLQAHMPKHTWPRLPGLGSLHCHEDKLGVLSIRRLQVSSMYVQ
jgi:hypothetical protein